MGSGPTPVTLKPSHPAAQRGLKAVLMMTALVLLPVTAAPQSSPRGSGSDRQTLSQDANGPERAEQAIELTMLARERFPRPSMDGSVPPIMRYQLAKAYDTAIRVLRREPGCRTLFQRLGANGEDVLARSRYYAAGESRHCQEGVPAFTNVGSTQIKLCRSFGELQASSAAVLLLHEALHSSGLRESPGYPNALTAREINVVVSQGCSLQ
ncbi:MAG: hypothetical protein A2Y78_13625 [Acidobacteria bacterium RBG_13_68_16]|jgi:hypothetical protein|nr:MAG: hypothetical protein A2Y78_13625 [Acidobacteria bacterium RBG_13_68_16]